MKIMCRGFTLIEMAIVLVILGLLVTSFLTPTYERLTQRRIKTTQERLEKIKEALLGYLAIHGHLPCPALDMAGKEAGRDAKGWTCKKYDNYDSYLPWLDLGSDEYRYDAWGRPFRYRVDGWFSNSTGIHDPDKENGKNFPVGSAKSPLKIIERPKNDLNYAAPMNEVNKAINTYDNKPPNHLQHPYISNIVAVVFSCGKNGRPDDKNDGDGEINTDAMCSNPPGAKATKMRYMQGGYVENTFDDIVIWIPKHVLISYLATMGKWPPPFPPQ